MTKTKPMSSSNRNLTLTVKKGESFSIRVGKLLGYNLRAANGHFCHHLERASVRMEPTQGNVTERVHVP